MEDLNVQAFNKPEKCFEDIFYLLFNLKEKQNDAIQNRKE